MGALHALWLRMRENPIESQMGFVVLLILLGCVQLDDDDTEYEAEEAEFEGEAFEQEDFDEESFQAAVASQTGLEAEDYEDVDELDDEARKASEIATLKARHKRRRRVPTTNDKRMARRKGSSKATVRIHRSHSE